MKFKYVGIFVLVFFLNNAALGQEESDWKLVKTNSDVKAYVKKVSYIQINKVKVESVVETTLSELVTLIKDAKNHCAWVFLNEKAEIIEVTNDFKWKYYAHISAPWPVTDRDFITDVTLKQNNIDYSITILSVAMPDFLPDKEDCVRIPYIISQWTLNPLKDGQVHVSLEIEVDIGGTIPAWLVNLAVTKGPLSTMNGLIRVLQTDKYKGVILDYVDEF
ncbi:MAG: hypothetical protein H8E34_01305 [Bacteroidetes bacterium]|nr:hypothetical protein [Bacteroidota bacterium]MBL6943072.1 hypothetical protein [Bacteroidales bacterium]